jgi:hypothetical protein
LAVPAGYIEGWPAGIFVEFVASKYDRTKGFGIFGTDGSGLNLKFTASGGDLEGDLEGDLNLSSRNVLSPLRSSPNPLKLTSKLNAYSGVVTGTFKTDASGLSRLYSGVVFQKTNHASGFFRDGTRTSAKSGWIQIKE